MDAEPHFQDVKDIGVAWEKSTNRVWVCLNGISLLRVKFVGKEMLVEYTPPQKVDNEA